MKEKELKKLGRLELLELLLEVSKENKEIKEQIEILKTENETLKGAENISEAAKEMNDALLSANRLVEELKAYKEQPQKENSAPVVEPTPNTGDRKKRSTDRNLYYRLLEFYSRHTVLLDIFPPDIKHDLTNRINKLSDSTKN